ncbi:prealbumin-like fold domain-containing protein [Xanthomonas nasturtii]|uniref:prealbumin-like fold domain-containing protein n=1 Tax=Xanthomonas nasturtii TaxID=1843581 RepID=UPI002013AB5E|nr:prealbumin-like fold domain-containing protein [Xanthomonas nasturtii]MCL1524579.1 prealbumin-like fold domain-containing protein [Xanthomonas nasturtii]
MKTAIASIAMLACLAACASLAPPQPRQVALTTLFSPQEVAWFTTTGMGSVTGQAFFQTRGGQPRTCAGLEVSLQPHSTYGDERLTAIYGNATGGYTPALASRVQFTPDDLDYQQVRKTSICDAQGNFSFTGLPAGKYFLVAAVVWTVPGQEFAPPQGGPLMKSFTLADGETKRVILTP